MVVDCPQLVTKSDSLVNIPDHDGSMGSLIVDFSEGQQSMGRQDCELKGKRKKLNVYVDPS